ncbi:hypothetical protein BH09ACT5_BH09ACT5_14110 [soil metagenome]
MTVIAITGASSSVGSAVADECARRGFDVVPLVRRPVAPTDRAYDLGSPPSEDLLSGVDALIHLAWDWTADEAVARAHNLEGSRALLALARAGGARPVLLSTFSVFAAATSSYGAMKGELEELVAAGGGASLRAGLIWGGSGEVTGILATVRRLSQLPLCAHLVPDPRLHASHLGALAVSLVELAAGPDPSAQPVRLGASHGSVALSEVQHAFRGPSRTLHPRVPVGVLSAAAGVASRLGVALPFRPDSLNAVSQAPLTESDTSPYPFEPGFDDIEGFLAWAASRR